MENYHDPRERAKRAVELVAITLSKLVHNNDIEPLLVARVPQGNSFVEVTLEAPRMRHLDAITVTPHDDALLKAVQKTADEADLQKMVNGEIPWSHTLEFGLNVLSAYSPTDNRDVFLVLTVYPHGHDPDRD